MDSPTMRASDQRARVVKRYLLGQLSEPEAERVERAYLSSEESFELMLAVEDELFFEYAGRELTDVERRRFEERLLRTPEDWMRLSRVRRLAPALGRPRAVTRPELWWAVAAALLVATTLWRAAPEPAGLDPERSITALGGPTRAPVVALTAGAEPARVSLPRGARVLELRLPAGLSRSRARAVLRSSEAGEIWARELDPGTGGDGGLVLRVPAAQLAADDYQLTVTSPGAEPAVFGFSLRRD